MRSFRECRKTIKESWRMYPECTLYQERKADFPAIAIYALLRIFISMKKIFHREIKFNTRSGDLFLIVNLFYYKEI